MFKEDGRTLNNGRRGWSNGFSRVFQGGVRASSEDCRGWSNGFSRVFRRGVRVPSEDCRSWSNGFSRVWGSQDRPSVADRRNWNNGFSRASSVGVTASAGLFARPSQTRLKALLQRKTRLKALLQPRQSLLQPFRLLEEKTRLKPLLQPRRSLFKLPLLILAISLSQSRAEETTTQNTFTGLPTAADAQVARYMNLLIQDPRNDFLFGEVFRIYKTHKAEYRLLSFLKGSIKAKPDEKNLWILLGLAYREFRDLFLARKYFNKAIEIDPKDYFPRYLTAQVVLREGKLDEAIAGFRTAADIASDPEDKLRAREALAKAFLSQSETENFDKAAAELDAILKEREFDTEVHWRVARIYEDHGLHEQAVSGFHKIVELADDDEPELACRSWMRIAGIWEEADPPEGVTPTPQQKAIAAYLKARELIDEQHWLSEKISSRILDLYRATGRADEWLSELQSRIEKRPRDVELRKETARALAAAGKMKEAAEVRE